MYILYQQLVFLVQLSGDDGFLLIAARHAAGDRHGALAGADVKCVDQFVRVFADGLSVEENAPVQELRSKVSLKDHVVFQRIVEHQAVLMSVFRDMA